METRRYYRIVRWRRIPYGARVDSCRDQTLARRTCAVPGSRILLRRLLHDSWTPHRFVLRSTPRRQTRANESSASVLCVTMFECVRERQFQSILVVVRLLLSYCYCSVSSSMLHILFDSTVRMEHVEMPQPLFVFAKERPTRELCAGRRSELTAAREVEGECADEKG